MLTFCIVCCVLASPRCLTFYYYMYGSGVGSLRVYTQSSTAASRQEVWVASGNKGRVWNKAEVYIHGIDGIKVSTSLCAIIYVCAADIAQ
jgi:hypothetical protein